MKNFKVKGIIASNPFRSEKQIDVVVAIQPMGDFLDKIITHLKNEANDEIESQEDIEEILESLSILVTATLDCCILKKEYTNYVQLEELGCVSEDYDILLNSVISKEEVEYVESYVFDFLKEREKTNQLWNSYLG